MSTEPDQPVVPAEPGNPEPPVGSGPGAAASAASKQAAAEPGWAEPAAAESGSATEAVHPSAGEGMQAAAPGPGVPTVGGPTAGVPSPEVPIAGVPTAGVPTPEGPTAGVPRPDLGPDTPPPAEAWSVTAGAPQPGVRYDVPQDQKNLAMLSTLGMLVVSFVSPLIVFAVTNGDPSRKFVNDHAKEGLNFSIVLVIASAVTALLMLLIIGFLLVPLLFGWSLWVVIAGTIQASNGEAPHYPLVPKILK